MRYFLVIGSALLVCLYFSHGILGQQATTSTPQRIQAELLDTIKTKKAKPGDIVKALTTSALVLPKRPVIPIGSKLFGHIHAVEAGGPEGSTSSVAISFDEVEVKRGQRLPLQLSIRAALMPSAMPQTSSTEPVRKPTVEPVHKMNDPSVGADRPMSGGRYTLGDTAAASVYAPQSSADSQSSSTGPGAVTVRPGSVVGMPGVELELDDGPAHASKFKSTHKNLELQQGLVMGLAVVQ